MRAAKNFNRYATITFGAFKQFPPFSRALSFKIPVSRAAFFADPVTQPIHILSKTSIELRKFAIKERPERETAGSLQIAVDNDNSGL
ncbi:hypothetical protein Zmor_025370 [Zophobas morio]|uniref:Uncharacterized protein n=1 Tax=Zophobas morio TaxID=2755281 RepID=A0AA38M411_9CUCU|nr:hypothetical protein Zmor_025370 [Zophobas morio]